MRRLLEGGVYILFRSKLVWPLHFMAANILKVVRSYRICAMQNVSRIFSNHLQFGTIKQAYVKIWFREKRKLYGVDSLTTLKTWMFQDNENTRKMNCLYKLSVYKAELINLLVPLQLSNEIYKDYDYYSCSEIHGYFNCQQAISL